MLTTRGIVERSGNFDNFNNFERSDNFFEE